MIECGVNSIVKSYHTEGIMVTTNEINDIMKIFNILCLSLTFIILIIFD